MFYVTITILSVFKMKHKTLSCIQYYGNTNLIALSRSNFILLYLFLELNIFILFYKNNMF